MIKIELSKDDIEELQNIIVWAVSEGYNTNLTTKNLAYKLKIDKEILKDLDENDNIGIKLME